jgi:hypothetical protein
VPGAVAATLDVGATGVALLTGPSVLVPPAGTVVPVADEEPDTVGVLVDELPPQAAMSRANTRATARYVLRMGFQSIADGDCGLFDGLAAAVDDPFDGAVGAW